MHRTRHDIGFDITKIAADTATACADVDASLDTPTQYNRTGRVVKYYDQKPQYSSRRTHMDPSGEDGNDFRRCVGLFFLMRDSAL